MARWNSLAGWIISIRGHRKELGEIEATLELHPDVKRCVVVVPDVGRERRLIAYFIAEGAVVSATDLSQWLTERLPSYMIPSAFVLLPTSSAQPSGKIDRKALFSPDSVAALGGTVPLAPRN